MGVKISGMTLASTPLAGTERVELDVAGVTRSTTTQDIANLGGGSSGPLVQTARVDAMGNVVAGATGWTVTKDVMSFYNIVLPVGDFVSPVAQVTAEANGAVQVVVTYPGGGTDVRVTFLDGGGMRTAVAFSITVIEAT